MRSLRLRAVTALIVLGCFLSTAALPHASAAAPTANVVVASKASKYWQGFVEFWSGAIRKQSGVVLISLGVGAVSLFIITRAKWRKG